MSSQSLVNFLKKLDNDLSHSRAGVYRELVANRRPHRFKFNALTVASETFREMELRGILVSKQDKKVIRGLAHEFKNSLESEVKWVAERSEAKLKITKHTISMVFTTNTVVRSSSKWSNPDSVFDKLRDVYRPHLKVYFEELQNYLREQSQINEKTGRTRSKVLRTKSGKEAQAGGRVLNAGHVGEAGVLESLMADLFNDLVDIVGVVADDGSSISSSDIREDLKSLGVDLSIVRNTNTSTHTISLESGRDNSARGREIYAKRNKLIDEIKSAITKLEKDESIGVGLSNLKGSDSFNQIKRKTIIKNTEKPFKKIKGVTTKFEDTTIKHSNNTQSLNKAVSAAAGGSKKYKTGKIQATTSGRSKARTQKGVAGSPLALIAEINRKLPETIAKNMGSPALNYRSGRFAASARVTDVIKTPQGYPSFGYTYQKYPYQTFEPGFAQGSVDRDPRTLITKSIREIALQFAIGRFYTRRV